MITPGNARGRPVSRPRHAEPASSVAKPPATRAEAVLSITHGQDDALAAPSLACPCCGHDLVSMLRQVVAERREAWRDGYQEGREGVDEARLGAYSDGWRDGLEAGAERRTAA